MTRPKLRATRAQLRGKPLGPDCHRARISKHEFGPDDERCYCLGLFSGDCETIDDECYKCGAFVYNATLPKELETNDADLH
jgi:hypothetical protein